MQGTVGAVPIQGTIARGLLFEWMTIRGTAIGPLTMTTAACRQRAKNEAVTAKKIRIWTARGKVWGSER